MKSQTKLTSQFFRDKRKKLNRHGATHAIP